MTRQTPRVERIMESFGERTGLTADRPPRRYLWTDAFAASNYLALHRQTGDARWRDRLRALIHQVHHVLGRHAENSDRTGWISGLPDEDGERHPTIAGLRIGKPLPERGPHEPFDDELEWERDGQYYHYLTRWMHALVRSAEELGDLELLRYAAELARSAHAAFAHPAPEAPGGKALYWKMSIDLSRPLVPSMGHHDPLDGLAVAAELDTLARSMAAPGSAGRGLSPEVNDLSEMCRGRSWVTSDALGIGGLLAAAWQLARVGASESTQDSAVRTVPPGLVGRALSDAARSLELTATGRFPEGPAHRRLAFRELGLSLGLAAAERLREHAAVARSGIDDDARAALDRIAAHIPLKDRILGFWVDPANQESPTWTEHEDISSVMLATGLAPHGYLGSAATLGAADSALSSGHEGVAPQS